MRWPPSPSPITSYVIVPTIGPMFTTAPPFPTATIASAATTGAAPQLGGPSHQYHHTDGTFYGGLDGTLLYGGSSPYMFGAGPTGASPYLGGVLEPAVHGAGQGMAPPHFYKLEFTTYDGSEDPLNWLNHCE